LRNGCQLLSDEGQGPVHRLGDEAGADVVVQLGEVRPVHPDDVAQGVVDPDVGVPLVGDPDVVRPAGGQREDLVAVEEHDPAGVVLVHDVERPRRLRAVAALEPRAGLVVVVRAEDVQGVAGHA
jgi:hypothetical protein